MKNEVRLRMKLNRGDIVTNLRALHKTITTYRRGKTIDIDQVLDQMREERDHEILGVSSGRRMSGCITRLSTN